MEITEITYQKFEELSPTEQRTRLQWNLKHLVENQQRVNATLTVARNYEYMIPPFKDAYSLNKMVRKYIRIHLNSEIPIENPNFVPHFTWAGLRMLCADTNQLLEQFLKFEKPEYAMVVLINATNELDNEQERIIKEYHS